MVHLHVLFLLLAALGTNALSSLSSLQRTVDNWVAIAQHLLSEDLYDASWASACYQKEKRKEKLEESATNRLLTTRNVQRGEILSLFPIHAINYGSVQEDGHDSNVDLIAFDLPPLGVEAELYRDSGLDGTTRLSIYGRSKSIPKGGWLGHLAPKITTASSAQGNCRIIPLVGAAPLCALVAIGEIGKGEELMISDDDDVDDNDNSVEELMISDDDDDVDDNDNSVASLSLEVLKRYAAEIAELRSFTTMAHPSIDNGGDEKDEEPVFHKINRSYPGLTLLNQKPEIIQIQNFLTADECHGLIEKARPHLQPCIIKNEATGAVEVDPSRTSTNANLPQSEIPSIVAKTCRLLNCKKENLEIFQILHYAPGEKFESHTDGFDGFTTACGFEQSGRLATLFCYLNECTTGGGETHFTQTGHKIAPRTGQAVVHFPNSIDLREDLTTEHESLPVLPGGEKWLLVTWAWKHARSDPRYHESLLPSLCNDAFF